MPGKVNPVIPEVVNQVAFQVIGADLVVTLAAEAGQLQLNAMEPVIVFNILQSMMLLTRAINTLTSKCVRGITANRDRCRQNLEAGTALATALVSIVGYDQAAVLAKKVLATGLSMRQVIDRSDALPPDLVDELIDVEKLVRPSRLRSPPKSQG